MHMVSNENVLGRTERCFTMSWICVFVVTILLLVAKVDSSDSFDNRLWSANAADGSIMTLYSCFEGTLPVYDPSAVITKLCFVRCLSRDCGLYEYGEFPTPAIQSAQKFDFLISNSNEVALLYSDDVGLHLSVCSELKCDSRTHIVLREVNTTSSKAVIGTFLALTPNSTWIVSFVEQTSSTSYRAVVINCLDPLCWLRHEWTVSQWTTTAQSTNSPIFVKVDPSGRPIVGLQGFSHLGTWLEVWRCELTESCTLQSNSTLQKPITAIRVANRREISDLGLVLLLGSSSYMFHFISSSSHPILPLTTTIDPQISPENEMEIPIARNPDFTDLMPSDETPFPLIQPHEMAPTIQDIPMEMPNIGTPESSEMPLSPIDAPFSPSIPDDWYQSGFNHLLSSDTYLTGFQGDVISRNSVPNFSLTYRLSSGVHAALRGYCNSTSCASSMSTRILYSAMVSGSSGLPQVSVATFASGDILYVIHTVNGALRRVVIPYPSSSVIETDEEFYLGSSSPKARNTRWDILGIVGIANAAVATIVVLLALTVFAIHFTVNRFPADDDPANWDASRLSSKQRLVLALYYTELKST